MRLWFSWVGHKRDGSRKSHLWGILHREENVTIRKYICWGPAKSRVYLIEPISLVNAYIKKQEKIKQGYKEISQDQVEKTWPEFMDDIEMKFMIEKLTQ